MSSGPVNIEPLTTIKQLLAFLYRWFDVASQEASLIIPELGHRLPQPLLELHAGFGSFIKTENNLLGNHDRLLPCNETEDFGNKVLFVEENQTVWCGFAFEEDGQAYVELGDHIGSREFFNSDACIRFDLTEFLVSFCLQECTFGGTHYIWSDNRIDHDEFNFELFPLHLNGMCTYYKPTHTFYTNSDSSLLVAEYPEEFAGRDCTVIASHKHSIETIIPKKHILES